MGGDLPFVRCRSATGFIAWRDGKGVTYERFWRDVGALAARLPDRPYVLNHCDDRYRFLVALAASVQRGQISLFPANRAPQVLADLRADFPDFYCITDDPEDAAPCEQVRFDTVTSADVAPSSIEQLAIVPNRIVAIAFTSGSTGIPKRHDKTWGGFVAEAIRAGEALGLHPEKGGCIVASVPPQHMYGFIASIMLPLTWGYVMHAARPFYPEDIGRALRDLPAPGTLVTTPVQLRGCVLEETALPALDFILSSAAPLDADIARRAEAMYGTPVLEFYGSTETGAIAIRRQADRDVWRTFRDVTVAPAASGDGLEVRAPWFAPQIIGDVATVHDPREFTLHGRAAELVKIGGKRMMLGDLTRQLLAIDGVRDGAFYAPDAVPDREARLVAFAVAPGRSAGEILAALRERIDPVFLPRPLKLVEKLPRAATGKLPRAALAELLRQV
jgi:acyl-coenzyme A synthetase/AMP-(fatty) acid ligase